MKIQKTNTLLVATLIVAIITGCASTSFSPTAPVEALASYKRIGVVSITAQRLWRVQENAFGVDREHMNTMPGELMSSTNSNSPQHLHRWEDSKLFRDHIPDQNSFVWAIQSRGSIGKA